MRRVHERDMGERLREIANQTLSARVIFLREQPNVVAQGDQLLKQPSRVRETPDQDIGVGKPEAAGKEGAFTGRQPVLGLGGVISEHESPA